MPLPTITVTGTWAMPDQTTPDGGTVTITPTATVVGEGRIIVSDPITCTVVGGVLTGPDGQAGVTLIAASDQVTGPFQLDVVEQVAGQVMAYTVDATDNVDLATAPRAAREPVRATFVPASAVGQAGGVAGLGADGLVPTTQLPPGNTGGVSSVNGQAGVVVLDAADVGALPDSYTAPVQSVAGRGGDVTLTAGDVSGLAAVATTGAYGDLSGTPAPVDLSDTPRALVHDAVTGWPARGSSTRTTIYIGGDSGTDAPTDAVTGDLWVPAS